MEAGIFELAEEGFFEFFGLGLVIGEGIDFGEGDGDKTGFNGVLSAGIKVEGVGVGIRLVDFDTLNEVIDHLAGPDYITISRHSIDLNAWSLSNTMPRGEMSFA